MLFDYLYVTELSKLCQTESEKKYLGKKLQEVIASSIADRVTARCTSPLEAFVVLDGGLTFWGEKPVKVSLMRCPFGKPHTEMLCRFHNLIREKVGNRFGVGVLQLACWINGRLLVWEDAAARAGVGRDKLIRVLKRNACLFAIEHFRR